MEKLVLIETSIEKCHDKFYITDIKNLAFNLSHVSILGTHQFGKELHNKFDHRGSYQDVK